MLLLIGSCTRMIQLRMHVKGEAQRPISGLGSKGIMYATALKSLKKQFGQPSVIARAVVSKLTTLGEAIDKLSKHSHRISSSSLHHAPSQLLCRHKCNDSLRRNIGEKGQIPTLQHMGDFVWKHIKAKFNPDYTQIISRETRGI